MKPRLLRKQRIDDLIRQLAQAKRSVAIADERLGEACNRWNREVATLKADLAVADNAHDELTRRLERHDAWIRRAKPFLHTLEIDDPELDWLIYMAPDVGEGTLPAPAPIQDPTSSASHVQPMVDPYTLRPRPARRDWDDIA